MGIGYFFCLLIFVIHSTSSEDVKEAGCHIAYDKFDRQALTSRNFIFGETWPNNEIPYILKPGFSTSDLKVIKKAMAHVEKHVCVKFVERSGQKNYLDIKHDRPGCFASLGYNRFRGRHVLNIQRNNGHSTCMVMGIIAHEMLHTLGMAHEQTRPDRDQYVKILWANIKSFAIPNYFRAIAVGAKERPPVCDPKSGAKTFDDCYSGYKSDTFGYAYDFGSIMHYGLNDFSQTGENTMETIAEVPIGIIIGNKKGMSELDSKKAQAKYGCDGRTTTTRKPGIECRDLYVQCSQYKHYCGVLEVITKGCKVSCGECEECYDKYSNCKDFAHLCGGNDDTDANCHLTCGTC